MAMWMVVGLGNPGAKYLMNRHNVGFMALDNFTAGVGDLPSREERKSVTCRFRMDEEEVLFVKPQTFMNKSGEAVRDLMQFYKIELPRLIVVHDEIEIPFGALRLVQNRGPGGHNGLKSINETLGSQDYLRIRIGVGRPPHPKMDVADWVLQNFSPDEAGRLTPILNAAGDAVETLIFDGYEKAASQFNRNFLEVNTTQEPK
ncbi:MAG: aminoacyl-tRNA hydrolase [Bdellovibrionaceae bacterium]|nr:aminoacyl-tRNA hydrolase [Pseudobdellovibrionaceae bacterium]